MFVCGFDVKVSFQSAVDEHYFQIKERDCVVVKGLVNLIVECRSLRYVMKLLSLSSPCVQRRNISSMYKRHQIRGESGAAARVSCSNLPIKRSA